MRFGSHRMRSVIFYLFVFILNATLVNARTYYVAEDSNSSGNGLSYKNRMSVETHNNSSFKPGDKIFLCGGEITSKIEIPSSGKKGKYIKYDNYSKDPAIITAYSSSGAVLGENKAYIILNNLILQDGDIGIVFKDECSNIEIRSCDVSNMRNKGIVVTATTASQRNKNIVIGGNKKYGNIISDVGKGTGGGDIIVAHSDEVEISYNEAFGNGKNTGIDGFGGLNCDSLLIEYNYFYGHQHKKGEDGIDLKGCKNVEVCYNVCSDNNANGINVNRADSLNQDCDYVDIHHNLTFENRSNIRIAPNYHNDITIWGNILYNSVTDNGMIAASKGSNFKIYNNSFVNNHGSGSKVALAVTNGKNYEIFNNIFSDNKYKRLVLVQKASNVNLDYNNYYFNSKTPYVKWYGKNYKIDSLPDGVEENGTQNDPEFEDIADYDFTVENSSDCLTAGSNDLNKKFNKLLNRKSTNWFSWPIKVNTKTMSRSGNWAQGAYAK